MAKLTAKGATSPQALRKTLTKMRQDFQRSYDTWQEAYPNFKRHLSQEQRARLKALGGTLWRFDLRFRWAIGVTSLEFDDRIITKAATGPTRQGYFLLMRLVDLWFSLDLAFDMYEALLIRNHVEHPSVLATVRNDEAKRLRVVRSADQVARQVFKKRLDTPERRERFVAYLSDLAEEANGSLAGQFTAEASTAVERQKGVATHHLLGVAQAIRNRYVHGGETASTRTFAAQEKAPILRLLTGTVQVVSLAMATTAADELHRQLRKQVGF